MISNLGYSIAAAGFLLILLLLLTVPKRGAVRLYITLAVLMSLLWALQINTWIVPESTLYQYLTFDLLKLFSWILFLGAILHHQPSFIYHIRTYKIGYFISAFTLLILCLIGGNFLPLYWVYWLLSIMMWIVLCGVMIHLRHNANQYWALKPLVIYLGSVSIVDVISYASVGMSSDVTLLDLNYVAAKGYIYALMMPFLFISVRRMGHWGVYIFISRHIVLHSTLFLIAGVYLFSMTILGYFISPLEGSWNTSVQIVLMILSGLLLITPFFSRHVVNQLKVWIAKHFFANQFDYREQWIELTNVLAQGNDEISDVYKTALKGLMNAVKYDSGVLCKVTREHYQIVTSTNEVGPSDCDEHILKQAIAFCRDKPWLIDLYELQNKPENYKGLDIEVHEAQASQFQFILPIYHNNELWGVAALFSQSGIVRGINWELRDYLNAVIAQVSNYVLHYEAARVVAENEQFSAFNRMSAFVVHDLKNVMAQVDLILCNAKQHKSNPEFIDDTFETLQYTQARMQKMLKQLTEKQLTCEQPQQAVDICSVITQIIELKLTGLTPEPQIQLCQVNAVRGDREKLSNVLYNLISNAQEATSADGSVTIEVSEIAKNNMVQVKIIDTGHGMSKIFIEERLFTPFDSTKDNAGLGIGAYDAKHYIEEIGGIIKVTSEKNLGSTFTLLLPIYIP